MFSEIKFMTDRDKSVSPFLMNINCYQLLLKIKWRQ